MILQWTLPLPTLPLLHPPTQHMQLLLVAQVVNCPEGNHNWFRISRVLVSLRLLGLIDEVRRTLWCSLGLTHLPWFRGWQGPLEDCFLNAKQIKQGEFQFVLGQVAGIVFDD